MRTKSLANFALALLSTFLSHNALSQVTFSTAMTGAAEAPSPGSPDGSGLGVVTVKESTIRFSIQVKGISTPLFAHIHKGAAGAPGPVVVDFNSPTFSAGVATGSVTATSRALADDIAAHPELYYLNVHTAEFPAGALRGQLDSGPPKSATVSATLTGAGEAPAAGAPEGGGVATVTFQNGVATFTLLFHGIGNPTASHIHRGVAGLSGPVVLGFNPVFTGGFATGTVPVSAALQADILSDPANYYVNVHTSDLPGGAIRGQLADVSPATYLPTVAKAVGLNGTNFVTDVRLVNATATDLPVTLDYFASSGAGLSEPTATRTVTVAANGQAVLNDVLGSLFQTTGSGSLRVVSSRSVIVQARVLNDLRDAGRGTTGVFVPGMTAGEARTYGTLALLSSSSAADLAAGKGFRTNVGYFNPGTKAVKLTLSPKRNDGTALGAPVVITVPGYSRVQQPVFDMIGSVTDPAQPDFFVSYTSDGPIFVYAVVVDNVTGDGLYLTGAPPR